ncbi:MAG: cohesin domain-containing protein [Chloroflexota bacterium]
MKRRIITLSLLALVTILLFHQQYLSAAFQPAGPSLTLGTATADPLTEVTIPLTFASDGNNISSLVFSIDFDETLLTFDDSDNNFDGVPDDIVLNVPASFAPSATYDASDSDGEIDFTIFDFAPPLATLPDGVIANITFTTVNAAGGSVAAVNFAADPAPSFGSTTGQSIAGSSVDGSVTIGEPATETPTPTNTAMPTSTATATGTATATSTATTIPTNTPTAEPPTNTPTAEPPTNTPTAEPPTNTPTPTETPETFSGKLFLPIIREEAPSAVFGRVVNQQGAGVTGVVLQTQTGLTAVSDSQGYYSFSMTQGGTYTITPSKSGLTFSPSNRSIFVPPNAQGLNFTAITPATATPTPTNTPQPDPDPDPDPDPTSTPSPSCWNGIVNGGFEAGNGWTIGDNEYWASYSSATARSGSRSMRVGIVNSADNRFAYSSTWQYVTIPSSATDATLRFWLAGSTTGTLGTQEVGPLERPLRIPISSTERSLNDDAQYVLIYDAWGNQHTLLYQRHNHGWQQHSFNLGSFAGQQIRIYFGVYNNGFGGVTGMYVDDVELTSCN